MRPSVLVANNYAHVRGGSDRFFLDQVALFRDQGHRVRGLAARPPSGQAPEDFHLLEPVELGHPGAGDVLRFHFSSAARRAVQAMLHEDEPPEIAHLHIYHGQVTPSILAPLKRAGVAVVQTLHEYHLACPISTFVSQGRVCEACSGGHFWRALPRRCNRGSLARTLVNVSESYAGRLLGARRRVDLFLAPSEFMRQKMIAHGLAPERIETLPYFVDPARFSPAEGPGEHFLYAGRLERLKGIFTLLRAAARVPEVPLLVAGEGEARGELEATIRSLGIEHVRVLGHQNAEALADLVRGARCVIVPSEWYENLPLAVLEAMACARAVIGTQMGGIPELVSHDETGFLVPPGDEDALTERLRWAAAHGPECAALGRAARARVEREFSPRSHYLRLLATYQRLLA